MNTRKAYDEWSAQYDTDRNRTRDLEGIALRTVLHGQPLGHVLEVGCGTGKNTLWLAERADHITAVDLSEGMLAKARTKVTASTVTFVQGDVLQPWSFAEGPYDLVTFSLVLEHIEELGSILRKTAEVLARDGRVYIGELHPFKQYLGTKARFGTAQGTKVVQCFTHHVSDFVAAAKGAGLRLLEVQESFDADEPGAPPRILTLLFGR